MDAKVDAVEVKMETSLSVTDGRSPCMRVFCLLNAQ